ncbi:MAG: hypothetical protein OEY33_07365, partial [Bdellovibrionales bacterium]|nr:hypothetical protein [Bdellovibrionales bacterium]
LDEETIKLIKETNCRYLAFAPESGSSETIKSTNKRLDLKKIMKSIQYASKCDLVTKLNMVIGFPDEKREDIFKTILFSWKCAIVGVHDIGINIFSPYPGSKLFYDLVKEGTVVLNKDYFDNLFKWEFFNAKEHPCKNVGSFELYCYNFFGMLVFFILTYTFHPRRIIPFLAGIPKRKYKTRMEKFILGFFSNKESLPSILKVNLAIWKRKRSS